MKNLLTIWNKNLLEKDWGTEINLVFPHRKNWFGCAPASKKQIQTTEERLKTPLPDSYREFLTIANGWSLLGDDYDVPGSLLAVNNIDWFRLNHHDWVKEYQSQPTGPEPQVEIYSNEQDSAKFCVNHLAECLQVSGVSEGGVVLLNPAVKTVEGEWEAWHFSNHLPGALRFPSFKALVQYFNEALTSNDSPTRDLEDDLFNDTTEYQITLELSGNNNAKQLKYAAFVKRLNIVAAKRLLASMSQFTHTENAMRTIECYDMALKLGLDLSVNPNCPYLGKLHRQTYWPC